MRENNNIKYYKEHYLEYYKSTVSLHLQQLDEFMQMMEPGGKVIDLGCGSGRDSKELLNNGFEVEMVDGSYRLADLASKYTNHDVICATFQNYTPTGKFQGLWSCSSLLHLDDTEIISLMNRLIDYLEPKSPIYTSFKYGEGIRKENGRHFNYKTEKSMDSLISKIPGLRVVKHYTSEDLRDNKHNEWLSTFLIVD